MRASTERTLPNTATMPANTRAQPTTNSVSRYCTSNVRFSANLLDARARQVITAGDRLKGPRSSSPHEWNTKANHAKCEEEGRDTGNGRRTRIRERGENVAAGAIISDRTHPAHNQVQSCGRDCRNPDSFLHRDARFFLVYP